VRTLIIGGVFIVASCGAPAPAKLAATPTNATSAGDHDARAGADDRACFRGKSTWSSSGLAAESAPAYLFFTLDPAASSATAKWIWLNPADPSHAVQQLQEQWRITGDEFEVAVINGEPTSGVTGVFLEGEPWHWTKWRVEVQGSPRASHVYEWTDGKLHSTGSRTIGSPGEAYYLVEQQKHELVQGACDEIEQELAAKLDASKIPSSRRAPGSATGGR
jgi:hypothetical protein